MTTTKGTAMAMRLPTLAQLVRWHPPEVAAVAAGHPNAVVVTTLPTRPATATKDSAASVASVPENNVLHKAEVGCVLKYACSVCVRIESHNIVEDDVGIDRIVVK